jgi:hypothetical protein
MKTIRLLIIGLILIMAGTMQGQVSVSVKIGPPPPWGPVGYTQVRYYYLPDVEAYYDVQSARFIYYSGGTWVHRASLPSRYRSYDLYGGYKVVMSDYHGSTPYAHFKDHKVKYAKGYHGQAQPTVGKKPGNGHSEMKGSQGPGKSSGKGHPDGKGKTK